MDFNISQIRFRVFNFLYKRKLISEGANIGSSAVLCKKLFYGNVSKLKIGNGCYFEEGVRILINHLAEKPGRVTIGNHFYINRYSIVDCHYDIEIGHDVIVGPHVYICDFDHNTSLSALDEIHRTVNEGKKVVLEDNVWLGAGSKILKGVTIGRNSVVAAGAVVTTNVPSNVIVGGVPAKIIKNL